MSRGSRKIAVIGAGNVGATCAFVLANMKIADIVLLDIYEGFAKGKALDMSQNANVLNYDGKITGTSSYEDIAGADVVIMGIPLGTCAAPNRTALYPARLSWLELTSIDCARLSRRGIMSIDIRVMFEEIQSLTN